jgi:integrase
MRILKRPRARKWTLEIRDHLEIVRRIPGLPSKRHTEALGEMIDDLVQCKASHRTPTEDVCRWLEGISAKLRERLAEIGLLDRQYAAAGQTLAAHVAEWGESLASKGTTAKQIHQQKARVNRVVTGCGWLWLSDMNLRQAEAFLQSIRGTEGISHQTHNFYCQALNQFAKWMVLHRRISENPFDRLDRMNIATDRRHDRRALTQKEQDTLLTTTAAGLVQEGMAGIDRYWLYRMAMETGLRCDELRTLTAASFDLVNRTVTVLAGYSKHRRQDVLPLGKETCNDLQAYLTGKEQVFPTIPPPEHISRMVQADLAAAGIEYVVDGLYADFHALRHSFITEVVKSGASVKECQTLARHSTPVLTLGKYTHIGISDTRQVIDRMAGAKSKVSKTGKAQ